jgi:signal peptidase I
MNLRRIGRELGKLAAFALIIASARSTLADHYHVPSGSMEPTIEVGDQIVVDKEAYGLHVPFTHAVEARFTGPQLGDDVVLDDPEADQVLLKRVVATPGTTIEVRDGHLTIDGVPAPVIDGNELVGDVRHPVSFARGGGPDFGPVTIPDDEYLVMGDNRGDSRDGRYFGLVDRAAILGHALGVYWRGGPTWKGL